MSLVKTRQCAIFAPLCCLLCLRHFSFPRSRIPLAGIAMFWETIHLPVYIIINSTLLHVNALFSIFAPSDHKNYFFFMLLWVFVRSFVSLLTRVHIIFHAQRTIDNTQPKPKLFLNCFEDAALCVRSEKNAYPDKGWKRLLRWLWYSSHEWCVGFVQGLYKGLTLVTVKTF